MSTKALISEAIDKHRELRQSIMSLLEKSNTPNMGKEKMRDELFKIYLDFK